MSLKRVNDNGFCALAERAESPIVVLFTGVGCGVCRAMRLRVEQLSSEFEDRVLFLHVLVEEDPAVAALVGGASEPGIVVLSKKQVIDKIGGERSVEALRAFLVSCLDAIKKGGKPA